jgi:hypothetical protein
MVSVNMDLHLQTELLTPASGLSLPANTLITNFSSMRMSTEPCNSPLCIILISSWYHSHVGTQSLTCHGALIVLPKCGNPANCPCTHVNCGGNGEEVYDHIAGDWSPTIGVDVTLKVDINFPGGHVSISDTTSISYSNGQGGHGDQGSSNTVVVSSDGSSHRGSSSSEADPSSLSSDSSSDSCCKCKCKHSSKRKGRKNKRDLKARDDGSSVATPPYAFDSSCSKSPIPYDEERIIILEDAYYDRDTTLTQTALYDPSQSSANLQWR